MFKIRQKRNRHRMLNIVVDHKRSFLSLFLLPGAYRKRLKKIKTQKATLQRQGKFTIFFWLTLYYILGSTDAKFSILWSLLHEALCSLYWRHTPNSLPVDCPSVFKITERRSCVWEHSFQYSSRHIFTHSAINWHSMLCKPIDRRYFFTSFVKAYSFLWFKDVFYKAHLYSLCHRSPFRITGQGSVHLVLLRRFMEPSANYFL